MRSCLLLALLSGCGPTQLAMGDITLEGVTSDGFAIVAEKNGKILALSLSDQSTEVIADDRDTFVQTFASMAVGFRGGGSVEAIWTHATGNVQVPAIDADVDYFRAAPDGSAFAFRGPSLTMQTVGGQLHATNYSLAVGRQWQFVGHELVAMVDDGSLTAFDPDTGAATTLVNHATCPFAPDATGTRILACNLGDGLLVALDGSTLRDIGPDYGNGWIGANGTSVFYQTTHGGLVRDDGASKTILLADSTLCQVLDHAPDDGALLFSACPNDLNDELVRTVSDATPVLVPGVGDRVGPSFTADSSFALVVFTFLDQQHNGSQELDAFAVADGTKIVVPGNVKEYFNPDGARLLVVTHHSPNDDTVFDLQLIDLAQSDLAAKTLATGVDVGVFLAPDGKSVLFTQPGQGLFQQSL